MSYGIPGVGVRPPPGGQYPVVPMELPKAVVRVGEQALWSSQRYVAAAVPGNATVFVTPRGQVGQGFALALSRAETNLRESGRIPGGFAYDVFGIACQAYYQASNPIVGADIRNLVGNLVLLWTFLQTQIEVAPAMLIGAGGGIYGDTADTGAAEGGTGGSRINLNNGNGQLWIYQQHPVMLPSNSTFGIQLDWGTGTIAVDGGTNTDNLIVRVCLLGRFQTAIAVG